MDQSGENSTQRESAQQQIDSVRKEIESSTTQASPAAKENRERPNPDGGPTWFIPSEGIRLPETRKGEEAQIDRSSFLGQSARKINEVMDTADQVPPSEVLKKLATVYGATLEGLGEIKDGADSSEISEKLYSGVMDITAKRLENITGSGPGWFAGASSIGKDRENAEQAISQIRGTQNSSDSSEPQAA